MKVYTNKTKKHKEWVEHQIEIPDKDIMKLVLPKFKKMIKDWKVVDASSIMPGLKLHYRKEKDKVLVSFEEKNWGIAYERFWYTTDDLIDLMNF